MRRLLPFVLALVASGTGCPYGVASESGADIDPDALGDETLDCFVDDDCAPLASSCCGCPTFAAPVELGLAEVCEGVNCPAAPDCAPTVASCDEGRCVLACVAVETTQSCPNGFVVDDLGCTLDECAADLAPECATEADCVQAPADCCGCENGGRDTAIAAGTEAAHTSELACMGPISCPGVNTCEPEATVDCLGGTCRFFLPPSGNVDAPPALCGTTETSPCQSGDVCVLNHPDAADSGITGVGICQPAP